MTNVPGWIETAGGIVAATAAIAALLAIARKAWNTMRWVSRVTNSLEAFAEVMPQITAIGHEFKTNNGSSLRDAINRIEKKAERAEQLANEVHEMNVQQMQALTEIRDRCKARTSCDLPPPSVIT